MYTSFHSQLNVDQVLIQVGDTTKVIFVYCLQKNLWIILMHAGIMSLKA